MVRKGVRRTDIRGILGHKAALTACAGKIARITMSTQETDSNPAAARAVARAGMFRSYGAVGPITCADEWDLHVLDRDFSDRKASAMFYVMATNDVELHTLQPLTSRILVVFEVENVAGALVSVLEKVKKWSIIHITCSYKAGKGYRFGMELEVPGKEVSKAVNALRGAPARVIALPFPIVPISGCP
jgi:prephenate dehydratase